MTRQENMTLSSVLNFGKHKNKTIEWVKNYDKQYIDWLLANDIITLHPDTKREVDKIPSRRIRYYGGYDEDDAEMDFCLGLSGGAQGWD